MQDQPPAAPILSSPANGSSGSNRTTFRWNAVQDYATPITYEFQDALQLTGFLPAYTNDVNQTGTSYTLGGNTTLASGYWTIWRVRAIDNLGWVSNWSTT